MRQPSLIARMQNLEKLANDADKAETLADLKRVVSDFLRSQIKEAQEDALMSV